MGNCVYNINKYNTKQNSISEIDCYEEIIFQQKQSHLKRKLSFSKVKKIFTSYNILDNDINIVIGVWDNPTRTSELGHQGIWISGYDEICELTFGIMCSNLIVLNFKNNITLKIIKDSSFELTLKLTCGKNEYETKISNDVKKYYKKINDKSPDIDLIYNLINT